MHKLERYALNLLKPENDRPPNWRKLDFLNKTFQLNVGYLMGFRDIFKKLGYEEEIYNANGDVVGQKFPDSVTNPNAKMVEKVLIDLCIAGYEIDNIFSKKHPHFKMLFETKQIPPEYDITDDSDIEDGDFEEENDKYVLAPSPKSYNDQVPVGFTYGDPELEEGFKYPMEEKPFVERQKEIPGLQQIDHDIYTEHTDQLLVYREQNPQSGFGQPFKESPVPGNSNISSKVQAVDIRQASDSRILEQPFHLLQEISTRPDWSPTLNKRDEFSHVQQPSQLSPQDEVFIGSDQLSPLRQPVLGHVHNGPYQPSTHWLSEQRPHNSGLDIGPVDQNSHMQPHQVQNSKQIEFSNRNPYSSDTTWVYSSAVSTPMKSGPFQQSFQDADRRSMDIWNARIKRPQIYGADEEISNQNAFAERDHTKTISQSYFQKPSIYCDVQPPFSSSSKFNGSHEQYELQHSSNAPSQLQATGLNSNFRRMNALGNEYQNIGPATYHENESFYDYRSDRYPQMTSHPGRVSSKLSMGNQGYFSENGAPNLTQSHNPSQTAVLAQANIPSPPQGTYLSFSIFVAYSLYQGYQAYDPRARSGPPSPSVWPRRNFE